ncbi:MAG TPA: CpXC domain-containing protein [Chloroflexota bacterium]|nr:CpXC domain-containing protein [Chloroflexota bacterium]
MSKPKRRLFACSCGTSFDADVFSSANVTLQPDLKDAILANQFNRVRCPACGQERDAEVPFLYHDMDAGVMVWVYPAARVDQAEVIREKIRRSYEIVGTVLPTPDATPTRGVVFGIPELIDLLGGARPS